MSGDVVTVVVVLYGTAPRESPALTSLAHALGTHRDRFAVEVHDNSPEPSSDRAVDGLVLASDTQRPDNPGLAVPYSAALGSAERRGSRWLLLLDQDTRVTSAYVDEIVATVDGSVDDDPSVAVAAPLLVHGTTVLSPHRPLRLRPEPIDRPGRHAASSGWHVLNSGALLRVSALQEVGGFPADFPLDSLDHVVCARLRAAGYGLLVLRSRLEHDLSVLDMTGLGDRRLRSYLDAEERYYGRVAPRADLAWLTVRRTARAALVATRVRRSPNAGEELRAAGRAARLLAGRLAGGPR